MKKSNLLIFGTGTLAEVASYYFNTDSAYKLIGFVDMPEFAAKQSSLINLPVFSWQKAIVEFGKNDVNFFVAVGYQKTNSVRQERYEQIKANGYNCASYISSRASVMTKNIGENCFILENNVLQPFTKIGNNVMMWSGNHIGHHGKIDDHVFFTSHVVLSGHCHVKERSWFGVNSTIRDFVTIGEGSLIAMGSMITKSTDDNGFYMGSPAKKQDKSPLDVM
jgi:sugar O-acyltransferase (sialic acid O-acetyltransferase NeuD family)